MKNYEVEQCSFFDLDGTISTSKLNNTFDFIENYYTYKKMRRAIVKKYALTVLSRLLPVGGTKRRKMLINSFFGGLDANDLDNYCRCCYLPIFRSRLNRPVLERIKEEKEKGKRIVMLTACTEIPARILAEELGLDECIPTTFNIVDGRIMGISEDTFNDLKIDALERRDYPKMLLKGSDYYVDDTEAEVGIITLFGRVFQVDDASIVEVGSEYSDR